MDQLLRAVKIPAHLGSCRGGFTVNSSTHLLFASTLKKMGLNLTGKLTQSKAPFYDIVPGNSSTPIGTVTLLITFSTKENYQTEQIKFEVANIESSYHAILGRPALAKFMAVPHYIYLLLKMPGKTGVLSLRCDLQKSYECEKEAITYASSNRLPDASGEVLTAAKQLPQSGMEIPTKKKGEPICSKTTRQCGRQSHSTPRRQLLQDCLDRDRAG